MEREMILDFLRECVKDSSESFESNRKEFNDYSDADVATFQAKFAAAEGFLADLGMGR